MKLKLSCVATMMLFAGVAQAQSSVTLYGVTDTGLLYQSASAANFQSKVDLGHVYEAKDAGIAQSLWGMRGIEDIGGGYSVTFKLQGAFSLTSGKIGIAGTPTTTAVFNQQTSVGVAGPFGTIDAGRQIVPMIRAMADTDVRNAQYFGSILTAWLGMNQAAGWQGTSTNGPLGALYDDNAIVYQSPKFYGASLALEYAPGGVAGQFQGDARVRDPEVLELRVKPFRGLLQRPRYESIYDDCQRHRHRACDWVEQQPVLVRRRDVHLPRFLGVGLVQHRTQPCE